MHNNFYNNMDQLFYLTIDLFEYTQPSTYCVNQLSILGYKNILFYDDNKLRNH